MMHTYFSLHYFHVEQSMKTHIQYSKKVHRIIYPLSTSAVENIYSILLYYYIFL